MLRIGVSSDQARETPSKRHEVFGEPHEGARWRWGGSESYSAYTRSKRSTDAPVVKLGFGMRAWKSPHCSVALNQTSHKILVVYVYVLNTIALGLPSDRQIPPFRSWHSLGHTAVIWLYGVGACILLAPWKILGRFLETSWTLLPQAYYCDEEGMSSWKSLGAFLKLLDPYLILGTLARIFVDRARNNTNNRQYRLRDTVFLDSP